MVAGLGRDGLPAGRIGETLALAPATLSFHLRELSHAGLVRARQDGRFIHYSADPTAMNELLRYLGQICRAEAGADAGDPHSDNAIPRFPIPPAENASPSVKPVIHPKRPLD